MKTPRYLLSFWLSPALWFMVIHGFSSTPAECLPNIDIPHADKIAHILEYFVLGALLIRAFDRSAGFRLKTGLAKYALLTIIISLSYSVFDEFRQRCVPGRVCDAQDFLVDVIGAVIGVSFYMIDSEMNGGKIAQDQAIQRDSL